MSMILNAQLWFIPNFQCKHRDERNNAQKYIFFYNSKQKKLFFLFFFSKNASKFTFFM